MQYRQASRFAPSILLLLALASTISSPASAQHRSRPGRAPDKQWTLVWNDEFNGPDGSMPDATKWSPVTDGSGFGNQELEYYTPSSANVHLEKGNLVIVARKENFTGPDGVSKAYTSARLETAGRFQQQYGRFEARIKIPHGNGLWPAFWMLGSDFRSAGWPACGEIDIMENVGFEPAKVHGTLHGPQYAGDSPLTGAFNLADAEHFANGFHLFAVEWEPQSIRFYVDNTLYETQTVDSIPSHKHWAFDHPFFLLLNLAVGGVWPGNPDATTHFPAVMLVDYVRVYQRAADKKTGGSQ